MNNKDVTIMNRLLSWFFKEYPYGISYNSDNGFYLEEINAVLGMIGARMEYCNGEADFDIHNTDGDIVMKVRLLKLTDSEILEQFRKDLDFDEKVFVSDFYLSYEILSI
jgi:hypothetical protein